jgi:nucleotide-binding universal stress UspA family protein
MEERQGKARRPGKSARKLRWRRILVPIDFSKASLRALDVAVPLARDHGGRLFLLSVVEPAVFSAGMENVAVAVPDSVIAEESKDNLVGIARRLIPANVPVTVVVDRGRALDVISRVTKEQRIDLIVLTTHGRTGIDRFLMGSTAEQVVRYARCPVFVVRTARRAKKK